MAAYHVYIVSVIETLDAITVEQTSSTSLGTSALDAKVELEKWMAQLQPDDIEILGIEPVIKDYSDLTLAAYLNGDAEAAINHAVTLSHTLAGSPLSWPKPRR